MSIVAPTGWFHLSNTGDGVAVSPDVCLHVDTLSPCWALHIPFQIRSQLELQVSRRSRSCFVQAFWFGPVAFFCCSKHHLNYPVLFLVSWACFGCFKGASGQWKPTGSRCVMRNLRQGDQALGCSLADRGGCRERAGNSWNGVTRGVRFKTSFQGVGRSPIFFLGKGGKHKGLCFEIALKWPVGNWELMGIQGMVTMQLFSVFFWRGIFGWTNHDWPNRPMKDWQWYHQVIPFTTSIPTP